MALRERRRQRRLVTAVALRRIEYVVRAARRASPKHGRKGGTLARHLAQLSIKSWNGWKVKKLMQVVGDQNDPDVARGATTCDVMHACHGDGIHLLCETPD
jgi:hypothetical protein